MKTNIISTAEEMLLSINHQYQGDFDLVYKAILAKEPVRDVESYKSSLQKIKWTTLISKDAPKRLTRFYKPPFVLYYQGNLDLLSSDKKLLAIVCSRFANEKLIQKGLNDIKSLSSNIVIVTNNRAIIESCLENHRKIVVFLPNGYGQTTPNIPIELLLRVEFLGGLVITNYPWDTPANSERAAYQNLIIGGVVDAVWVIQLDHHSGNNIIISGALSQGKDILVYPTFPEYNNTTNNSLIAEGAILVENAKQIHEALGLVDNEE